MAEIHCFSLFAHMSVCIGQKYSVSKVLFSLLICMYWPSRTSTPSQSEIFCLIACSYTSRKRTFHFGRVYWSWKANTCIRAKRTRPLTQNISGQYRHTYEHREQESHIFTVYNSSTKMLIAFKHAKCFKSRNHR